MNVTQWDDKLEGVRLHDLKALVKRHASPAAVVLHNRANIVTFLSTQPERLQTAVSEDIRQCLQAGLRRKYERRSQVPPQAPALPDPNPSVHLQSVDPRLLPAPAPPIVTTSEAVAKLIEGRFMRAPTTDVVNACMSAFIDATSNAALRTVVCGCCARETKESRAKKIPLEAVPNRGHLRPRTPHPAHTLYQDMLLHSSGVVGNSEVILCTECEHQLASDHVPQFSLANDLWIGDIPRALKGLTMPEQMLVAKYFPAAYIVKLFPKKKGSFLWAPDQLQNGLKGNVSTYRLDPSQVVGMVEGNLMPRPARILSATIGVTFVGPRGSAEPTMPAMFRVRRDRVRKALQWLKENNPLYSDCKISEERLYELPEDGVPDEIAMVAKHSEDIESVQREHAGYVPDQEEGLSDDHILQNAMAAAGLVRIEDDDENEPDVEPGVIVVNSLGVVDVEATDLTRSDLMAHALANMAEPPLPEDYSVRRGSAFVNEYARRDPNTGLRNDGGPSNPNHLLGSFPTLFPYGRGAFEIERDVEVPYEAHARWAMLYCDRRFRLHRQFPFQVFGICQKRAVCRSAGLQVKKSAFTAHQNLLSTLTPKDLLQASKEETRGVIFSNPAVRALRSQLSAVRRHVKGTDESRQALRSEIWGTNLRFNPPSLWVTINPPDTQDPIAQVFAGAEIDLDRFCDTAGPTSTQRAVNISSDPFASAQFFHFIINAIVEHLFGIRKLGNGKVERKEGILGHVQAYIAAVEAQGRGSLHLHMLLWLADAPSAALMKEALQDSRFRTKIRDYIQSVIHADIANKSTAEVHAMPKTVAVSYSRPVDPRVETKATLAFNEHRVAHAVQLHSCSLSSCLRMTRGRLQCKRRAPWETAHKAWVTDVGAWGPKRLCPYLNNWNPALLNCIWANHDVKLIMEGGESHTLTWYLTNYATKKQQRTSNISALLAKRLAFHNEQERKQNDLSKVNQRLITRCANTLARDHEFSAPEIVSYIMGWGDRFESHSYVVIYWHAVNTALLKAYPGLLPPIRGTDTEFEQQDSDVLVTLVEGALELKDQLKEYSFRGDELENMSFFDFMLETYDAKALSSVGDATEDIAVRGVGRPPNKRVPYRPEAKKPTRCRVLRTAGHETLPRIVGKWFPRSDSARERELHAASMLALLRPWRTLADLKTTEETFSARYSQFKAMASPAVQTVISNIQYYHECGDGAAKRRQDFLTGNTEPSRGVCIQLEAQDGGIVDEPEEVEITNITVNEDDIERAWIMRTQERERLFGTSAIYSAYDAGIFSDDEVSTVYRAIGRHATYEEMEDIQKWAQTLKEVTRAEAARTGVVTLPVDVDGISIEVGVASDCQPAVLSAPSTATSAGSIPGRPLLCVLNEKQRMAHDMVEENLLKRIAGQQPPPLRLLVLGSGGTGKSKLIDAITETFAFHGRASELAKCATSGIAATDIGGQTVHSWACLPHGESKRDDWMNSATKATKQKRERNISGVTCFILDEVSMGQKRTLGQTSQVTAHIRAENGVNMPHEPFGGLDVILVGDFHQFPPVGNATAALYVHDDSEKPASRLGREIFLQFDKVVILTEQKRSQDPGWTDILARMRVGECTDNDIDEVNKLVLTHPECDVPDFSQYPWDDAILVTSRHMVRQRWNEEALKRHCVRSGHRRYLVSAEDTRSAEDEGLSMQEQLIVAGLDDKKTGRLADRVQLAVGMKAMVLLNIATDADLANGTRGVIEDIILDPREVVREPDEQGLVTLKYPPALVLFRPKRATSLRFPGIEAGLLPITPSMTTFTIHVQGQGSVGVRRRQLAMTPAYAFTDYKSQGQTIDYVIVDIGQPPSGSLSPFSVYVALSWSRGRQNIRLLRPFKEDLFTRHPSEDLRLDMLRMEALNAATERQWLAMH